MRLILGSSSPYRQQLLREMGLEFEVLSPDIDEKAITLTEPKERALALAIAKGDALLERLQRQNADEALLITADQVVAHGGTIREKPQDEEEARYFLRTAGEVAPETVSALAVTHFPTGLRVTGVDIVRIHLDPLPDQLIDELIEDGEIFYCAGGMRIEDSRVEPYIRHLEGSLDSVMGLPQALAQRLLGEVRAKLA